ncbi:MAG: hypothetical protein Q9222_000847 [Ikaeria aurantiellina]
MSGFLSSEAERALMGEEEEARRLFYSDPLNHPPPPGHPAYHGQRQSSAIPSQRWPSSYAPGPSNVYARERSLSAARPSPYAAESYTTSSWSSLHPDDVDDSSSQFSRSSSPGNPSDLPNFGYPLGDGSLPEAATYGSTFDGTPRRYSAAMKDAELLPTVVSRAGKIAIAMRPNTDQTSLASGKAVTGFSVEWTT